MAFTCRIPTLLIAALTVTPVVQAASGGIDSFSASATEVMVGDTVNFSVSYSLGTSSWSYGGSNTVEPLPQEGYQEWNVNWYSWESETLSNVWLQGGGQSFNDYPAAAAGGSYSNSWSFSVTFTEAGSFSIDMAGGWQSQVQSGFSNESATRNCWYIDPEAGGDLFCDSWSWQYSDANDWYITDGSMSASAIGINVTALPVPEPGTWALWMAGAGLLAVRSGRRRRQLVAASRRSLSTSIASGPRLPRR